jgi:hypothetical protein
MIMMVRYSCIRTGQPAQIGPHPAHIVHPDSYEIVLLLLLHEMMACAAGFTCPTRAHKRSITGHSSTGKGACGQRWIRYGGPQCGAGLQPKLDLIKTPPREDDFTFSLKKYSHGSEVSKRKEDEQNRRGSCITYLT